MKRVVHVDLILVRFFRGGSKLQFFPPEYNKFCHRVRLSSWAPACVYNSSLHRFFRIQSLPLVCGVCHCLSLFFNRGAFFHLGWSSLLFWLDLDQWLKLDSSSAWISWFGLGSVV